MFRTRPPATPADDPRADPRLRACSRQLAAHGPLWDGPVPVGQAGAVDATVTLLAPGRGEPWPRVRLTVRWGGARDGFLAAAAAAELREAWYVDPLHGWTERYRAPRGGRYRWRELLLPGEGVHLSASGRGAQVVPLPSEAAHDGEGPG